MLPRLLLDTAEIPGGGGTLRLMQRGEEYAIMLGGTELMNSRLTGSERALAELSCRPIARLRTPRVLIGGLGMGFTLRAALAELPPGARIEVAELVLAVIAWARGPLAGLFGGSLDDPRVLVHEADVAALIAAPGAGYDAIQLDVDNGPDGLSRQENDRLYSATGLAAARAALRPGGNLAIWSSAPDRAFTQRLGKAGFDVEEAVVRSNAGRGARHIVWIATRQDQER